MELKDMKVGTWYSVKNGWNYYVKPLFIEKDRMVRAHFFHPKTSLDMGDGKVTNSDFWKFATEVSFDEVEKKLPPGYNDEHNKKTFNVWN